MLVLRKLSLWELLTIALMSSRDDDDEYWDVITELRKRASRKLYKIARCFCQSNDPQKKLVGMDILAQFGWHGHYPFHKKRLRLLLHMIKDETDPAMLHNLAISLGHFYDGRANPALIKLKNHPDAKVRYGVAFGLYPRQGDLKTIDALIELSTDSDTHTRDWATFELGTQCDLDTEVISEALFARLSDSDDDVRGEAIAGLAKRKDERVFEALLAELETQPDWRLLLEAAEALADARLLPALYNIRERWEGEKDWIYSHLEDAIAACEGKQAED
jgi:hypothetical protein